MHVPIWEIAEGKKSLEGGQEGGEQSSCQVTRSQGLASLGKGTYKFS